MLTLEQIQDRYQKHTELYNKIIDLIKSKGLDKEFPISLEVMSELSSKLDKILNGLLIVGKADNLYCCYILYRTLLEHFYRSFYLTACLAGEKTDKTAEHFDKHYFISEVLAEQMGHLEMEDIQNEVEQKTDFLKYIGDKIPALKEFDKENQKEISEAIRKFKLKEIVKYLHKYFNEGKTDKSVGNFFSRVLPEYSMTSTFIHGGPYGTKIISRFKTAEDRQKEIQRIVGVGFSATCVAKENTLFAFKLHENDIKMALQGFQKLRDPNT